MSPKRIDRTERRRVILRAATEVFAARGYRAATMEEIAAAAGVAKGTLYLYFPSKEALFFALFERFADDAMAEGGADSETTNAVDAVAALLLQIAARIDADTVLVPLTLEFWSVAGVAETRDRFGARYGQMLDMFRGQITAMLRAGQRRGEVKEKLPLQPLASTLLGVIDGLIVQRWVDTELSVADTLREALPALMAGMRSGPGDARPAA
ncbi:TetR/AcrR family transcriptional regulator [Stakelama marina]|uniref:TetR/AcrR family transcriptional regulator n=1 Tax=Stakelama marina TaxID=2826939 RepID=A0A8T4IJU6_9SPHN|nr:TetR/AcrR family transcriptional regulator [Stakelama marina]MBR0553395.1 TetR/AcrR family transcriptional regulator [Stakelama marina]